MSKKSLFSSFKAILSQEIKPQGYQKEYDVAKSLRDTHLFRSLNGKEQEAVSVVDNRDISQGRPNNRVLITCEHASGDIKYTKLSDEEEHLARTQHFFDVGSAEMTYSLSEDLQCMAVMGNYTKLLVDPAKPLVDQNLIRLNYQWGEDAGLPVSFNNLGFRLFERLENFYLEYHKLLRESMEFLEPDCIINVHSHDPEYCEGRHPEVVIYGLPKSLLTDAVYQSLKANQINVSMKADLSTNDPDLCSPMILQNLMNFQTSKQMEGFYISIDSSKLLFEPEWSKQISDLIVTQVKDVCKLNI